MRRETGEISGEGDEKGRYAMPGCVCSPLRD